MPRARADPSTGLISGEQHGTSGTAGASAAREQETIELLQKLVGNRCISDGTTHVSELAKADDLEVVLDRSGAEMARFDAAPGRRSLMVRIPRTDPEAPSLLANTADS